MILEQNIATPHWFRSATSWLQECSSEFAAVDWSHRSPYIDPIDNLWDELKRSVRSRQRPPASVFSAEDSWIRGPEYNLRVFSTSLSPYYKVGLLLRAQKVVPHAIWWVYVILLFFFVLLYYPRNFEAEFSGACFSAWRSSFIFYFANASTRLKARHRMSKILVSGLSQNERKSISYEQLFFS